MYTDNKLLRRPHPYADESLVGYIARLADSNYYSSPDYILKVSALTKTERYANIFYPQFDSLCLLSHITGVSEKTLWSMAFSSVALGKTKFFYATIVQAFGENIPVRFLRKQGPRLCPVCLQLSPYYRQVWHLHSVTGCPFHKCFLIEKCPNCHQSIQFFRAKLLKCKCGFDLRNSSITTISAEQYALSYQISLLCQVPEIDLVNYTDDIQYLENLKASDRDNLSGSYYDLFEGLIAKDTIISDYVFFPLLELHTLLGWGLTQNDANQDVM
ncbi:TniQ family protein [Nostoc sp.]|uniref:TniQ family protein n=1 Tax=Nostoc sp. TaxID=1180 RepID=UPI002FF66A9C